MTRTLKFHLTAAVTFALLSSVGAAAPSEAYLTAYDGVTGRPAGGAGTDGPNVRVASTVDPEALNELRAYLLPLSAVVSGDADGHELAKANVDGRAYLTRGASPTTVSIRAADGKLHAFSLSTALALASEATAEACMVLLERDGVRREVSLLAVLAQLK